MNAACLLPGPLLSRTGLWSVGLGGALALWLGFPNDVSSLPVLALCFPAALAFLGVRAPGPAAALRHGWLSGMLGHTAVLYWLTLPMQNVGGLPLPLATACAVFVAACLALGGGLFAVAAHALRRRPALLLAVLLALLWFILEELAARALGFPWLPLAGALAVWPLLIQAADTVGAYALGGLWTLVSLLCLFALLPLLPTAATGQAGAGRCPLRPAARLLLTGCILAGLLLVYGGWRLTATPFTAEPQGKNSLDVLFVEGNIDQNQKWLPSFQRYSVEIYLGLTELGLAQKPGVRPLIVWPETALPFFFEGNTLYEPRIRELAARAKSPLLLGAPGREASPDGEIPLLFNRAFLLGPGGKNLGHYDKEHLVPFGEYLPQWLRWDFLTALLQGVGVYESGTTVAPLRHDNLALGMLICYEAIFPWLAQDRVADQANVLVDISNDGWFGTSPAARQHLYLTALRAVEQKRWLVRGTNTGISAVIDTRGRLTMRGGQFQAQALWAKAGLEQSLSLYHHLSAWLLPGAGLLFLALFFFGPGRSPSNHKICHAPSE